MPPSLGVNLRVTGHCNQGGRKYMEDVFSVAYQQTEDEKDLEYAFFGIYDGHGGKEASQYAKDHLMDAITKQKNFWSDDDDLVLKAIREGFLSTQQNMWNDLPNWKKTASGLPSTAGTTASVCFIKRGKLFIGHVGDSGIILGERDPHHPTKWRAKPLTRDHKPDCEIELARIHKAGGKVVAKSGVPRVVWYRPTHAHQGPVRRSTHIEEIPFLAVARALGDLWSYNAKDDVFVVSPDPDLHVIDLSSLKDKCLILATDGLWNVLSPGMAVQSVFDTERNNERHMIDPNGGHTWINPSKKLVDLSIQRWNMCSLRADNVSVVTVMLDPPGPPRAKVLRRLHGIDSPHPKSQLAQPIIQPNRSVTPDLVHEKEPMSTTPAAKGIAIISRFPNSKNELEQQGTNLVATPKSADATQSPSNFGTRIVHDSSKTLPLKLQVSPKLTQPPRSSSDRVEPTKKEDEPTSTSEVDPATHSADKKAVNEKVKTIQCSKISSSDNECDSPVPPPVPSRPPGGHRPSGSNLNPIVRRSVTATKPIPSPLVPGPVTRTRQQSGQSRPFPVEINTPSPPPLPVKQVRRSILPGYSGYNSDSENQPIQANKVTNLATPGGRHLRSSRLDSAKKSSVLSLAVTKPNRRSDATTHVVNYPTEKKTEPAKEAKTPENVTSIRVLRSRNTPAAATQPRRGLQAATPTGHTALVTSPTKKLPETGIKRKRSSHDSGVPTLAAKMLKLGQAKTSGWTNPIGKRNSSKATK